MLTKDTKIVAYKALVLDTAKNFKDVLFINISRKENSKENQLAVEASQLKPRMTQSVLVDILSTSSIATTNTN